MKKHINLFLFVVTITAISAVLLGNVALAQDAAKVIAASSKRHPPAQSDNPPSVCFGGPVRGFFFRNFIRFHQRDKHSVEAKTLGMSAKKFNDDRANRQTLGHIAADQRVSLHTVFKAVRTVIEEHIQNALAEGHITQNQANHLRACLDVGNHGNVLNLSRGDQLSVAAQTLGTSVNALEADHAKGRTVDQTVFTALRTRLDTQVKKALAAGFLIQPQADAIIDWIDRGGLHWDLFPGHRQRS